MYLPALLAAPLPIIIGCLLIMYKRPVRRAMVSINEKIYGTRGTSLGRRTTPSTVAITGVAFIVFGDVLAVYGVIGR
ncbi:hypothetical protein H4W26_001160 [Nesterenkonia halotolerans]|uniref:Uncharacterized protein n=1 Tax=Nesterenkonia halotolerans TaxID=225325 RepID=A0ABR9J676_9MICC|nr:hypothetical protein [Nesterenkonia halotolerans]